MAAWDNLSIAQRSQLMNIYRGYGITSLSDMRRMYNESHPQLEYDNTPTAPMYVGGGKKEKSARQEGESIAAWLKRIREQNATPTIDGGQIAPSVISATPETLKGKYKLAKEEYKSAKKEHKEIRRDIRKYVKENEIFSTDEERQPFIDRIDATPYIPKLRNDFKKARDTYYSNLNNNPNNIVSQLYRYYSRHRGFQRNNKWSPFEVGQGRGTDIISLNDNVIRLTPTSSQSTALFNEFVENKYPTVRPASDYKQNPNMIIGDNARFPASNVSIFGGIEDGAFKLDSLKNFSDATTIIPARNIKKGTPLISKINTPVSENDDYAVQSQPASYDWDKIEDAHLLFNNSLENLGNALKHYYNNEDVQQGIAEKMHNNQDSIDAYNLQSHLSRIDRGIVRRLKTNNRRYNRILEGKFPSSWETFNLATAPEVARRIPRPMTPINMNKYFPSEKTNSEGYTYTDPNGEVHSISDYNAAILDGKTVLANPTGGVFVGRIQDISRPQLDSLNAYLQENPSWLMRPDLGSFDQYRLDNPSLATYLKQYFEHPNPKDPNVYTIGTTTPNKLWQAYGGNLYGKGGNKSEVKNLIDSWVSKNPTYRGINTSEFADWLLETAGLESTYGKNMVGYTSNGKKSSYNGYFGLVVPEDAPFDTQMKKAYDKLYQILTDQITDYDIAEAQKKNISQAQLLHKYWNQGNRVTNYLHNDIDTADGAGTLISKYGNADSLAMDYSQYVRPAITDSTYTVQPKDTFSRIQSAVRVPGRNYNTAGDDLIGLQKEGFNPSNLRVGQNITLIKDDGIKFEDMGRPPKSDYYTRLNDKNEQEFQQWYFNMARKNGLALNPNDPRHAYDYRGFWKNASAQELMDALQEGWHGPDTYKWPTHETFSVESKYYNPKTMNGVGYWKDEKTFVPGSYNALMKATEPNMDNFMQMIEANREHSDGGSIHIKPENRGKFTALKERTGHSASWFKAHGTPAQKKMAIFALNARKWKHAHGGIKF